MGFDETVHPLRCPIPPRLSPHAGPVDAWLPGWLAGCGVPDGPAARLAAARFGYYFGRIYPQAAADDLRTLTAYLCWFFLLDDAVDGSPAPPLADIRALVAGVTEMLESDGEARPAAVTPPTRAMLLPAWQTIMARLPRVQRDRVTDAYRHHVDGVLAEAANKRAGRWPGVAEYVAIRRATSGSYLSYALIEFATGDRIPDAVYHHPVLRRASDAANDLLSWFNDLISLERDSVTADGHNIVLATAHERAIPVADAVRSVTRDWNELMDRFLTLPDEMPPLGPAFDAAVGRYLAGVANSVRATIDWSLESPRYPISAPVKAWLARRLHDGHD
jgi:hypothetical protein